MHRKPTLVSLQYLRGIAAMFVVYFHAAVQTGRSWVTEPFPLPLLGEPGVDIFFVLSGLVMWVSTTARDSRPLAFYRRRVIRIVPLYWAVTIAAALLALAIPTMLYWTRFDPAHLSASLLFIPWSNPAAPFGTPMHLRVTPVVVPGWTLNYEMFFYAIFGAVLLCPRRLRFVVLAAALTGVFLLCRLLAGQGDAFQFYGSTLLFEFLFGVVVAHAVISGRMSGKGLSVVLLIAGFALLLTFNAYRQPLDRAIVWGLPSMLIVYAAVSLELSGGLPKLPWLNELGGASYSIYITHVFTIALLRLLCVVAGVHVGGFGVVLFVLAAIVTSALAGVLVYRLYERPAMNLANRLLTR